jgi:hypothetical protein
MATPCAIRRGIDTAVLLGDDVLDVKRGSWGGEVWEVAILTPAARPFADTLAKSLWHQASAERLRRARALACKIAIKSIVLT